VYAAHPRVLPDRRSSELRSPESPKSWQGFRAAERRAKKMGKITVLSVRIAARGIRSIHEETSISELFI